MFKCVSEDIIKNKYKMKDGIIGFAIGDALGVPGEFKTREELKESPITDMIGGGAHNQPAGTWSDDTSMTIATMDSIIQKEIIDTNDIADRFLSWFRKSEYTAGGKIFDIGNTTIQALAKYELKIDIAEKCGGVDEYDNGNGSLMRMLPIIYYIFYKNIVDEKKIYETVKSVSSITHGHEISILGCYIYTRYTLFLLNGKDKNEAYCEIKKLNYNMFSEYALGKFKRILEADISKLKEEDIRSSGYIVDTLEATLWLFLNSVDYNSTVLKAVNLGEDTDTVAAITGGLLGIYYGGDSICDSWISGLKRLDYIEELCDKFEVVMKK